MLTRKKPKPISDTVRITPDGAIIVDTEKLFQKPRVQAAIRELRLRAFADETRRRMRKEAALNAAQARSQS